MEWRNARAASCFSCSSSTGMDSTRRFRARSRTAPRPARFASSSSSSSDPGTSAAVRAISPACASETEPTRRASFVSGHRSTAAIAFSASRATPVVEPDRGSDPITRVGVTALPVRTALGCSGRGPRAGGGTGLLRGHELLGECGALVGRVHAGLERRDARANPSELLGECTNPGHGDLLSISWRAAAPQAFGEEGHEPDLRGVSSNYTSVIRSARGIDEPAVRAIDRDRGRGNAIGSGAVAACTDSCEVR